MDLYWKIVFTLLIIGAISLIITAIITPFRKYNLEDIFSSLTLFFLGGGIAMIIIRWIFEILKTIWIG